MARRAAKTAKAERQPSTRSKKKADVGVEVVEESGGVGFEGGIAIATTVILVIAFLCLDALRGRFGEGMFF